MFKEIINDKNLKRRRESMLRSGIKSIGYIFILALFLAPVKASAGIPNFPFNIGVAQNFSVIADTDFPSFQIYAPFDKRNRDTFVQVTNTEFFGTWIHVQVFNDNTSDCNENSFWLFLTPLDTEVIDLDDPFVLSDPDGFGFVVITAVTGNGSTVADESADLEGNFRIIDDRGFEYRSNVAGFFFASFDLWPYEITDVYTFNFNNVVGTDESDVFGIAVDGAGTGEVDAGGAIAAIFAGNTLSPDEFYTYDSILQFDNAENPFNCDALAFMCGEPNQTLFDVLQVLGLDIPGNRFNFEFGINPALPSITAPTNICDAPLTTGFVVMPLTLLVSGLFTNGDITNAPPIIFPFENPQGFFVGFTGLNDGGNSIGSMDTWWAKPIYRPKDFKH
jgi:hypothetical protein